MRISDWSSDVCSSDLYRKPDGFPVLDVALRVWYRHKPRAGQLGVTPCKKRVARRVRVRGREFGHDHLSLAVDVALPQSGIADHPNSDDGQNDRNSTLLNSSH